MQLTRFIKKNQLPVVIFFFLTATYAVAYIWQSHKDIEYKNEDIEYKMQKPQGNYESSFLYQEVGYNCSQRIKGKWIETWVGNPGGRGYNFVPENDVEFKKFCRSTFAIEYRAVIDILKRDDVHEIIDKYDYTQTWVRALGHDYIEDKEFLGRILPAYSNIKIDCIIVVHSPEGTRFFLENGEVHNSHDDHKYIEVESSEFLNSLNNASDADITNFWVSLH